MSKSQVQRELEELRQKKLANTFGAKLRDAGGQLSTPEDEHRNIATTRDKVKKRDDITQVKPAVEHGVTSNFFLQQRQKDKEDRERKKEAAKLLQTFRGDADTVLAHRKPTTGPIRNVGVYSRTLTPTVDESSDNNTESQTKSDYSSVQETNVAANDTTPTEQAGNARAQEHTGATHPVVDDTNQNNASNLEYAPWQEPSVEGVSSDDQRYSSTEKCAGEFMPAVAEDRMETTQSNTANETIISTTNSVLPVLEHAEDTTIEPSGVSETNNISKNLEKETEVIVDRLEILADTRIISTESATMVESSPPRTKKDQVRNNESESTTEVCLEPTQVSASEAAKKVQSMVLPEGDTVFNRNIGESTSTDYSSSDQINQENSGDIPMVKEEEGGQKAQSGITMTFTSSNIDSTEANAEDTSGCASVEMTMQEMFPNDKDNVSSKATGHVGNSRTGTQNDSVNKDDVESRSRSTIVQGANSPVDDSLKNNDAAVSNESSTANGKSVSDQASVKKEEDPTLSGKKQNGENATNKAIKYKPVILQLPSLQPRNVMRAAVDVTPKDPDQRASSQRKKATPAQATFIRPWNLVVEHGPIPQEANISQQKHDNEKSLTPTKSETKVQTSVKLSPISSKSSLDTVKVTPTSTEDGLKNVPEEATLADRAEIPPPPPNSQPPLSWSAIAAKPPSDKHIVERSSQQQIIKPRPRQIEPGDQQPQLIPKLTLAPSAHESEPQLAAKTKDVGGTKSHNGPYNDKIVCYKCKEVGHIERKCPQNVSRRGEETARSKRMHRRCFNCGRHGHLASACSKPANNKSCYKCGEGGHISRDCPVAESIGN